MKDYYSILGIDFPSSQEEIIFAYRMMAKKWHPDLNPGRDVTDKMKDINEAAEILRDPIKKQRYDIEYVTAFGKEEQAFNKEWKYENTSYEPKDETLRNDINTARKNAEEYVKEFMASLRSSSKQAVKGAWEEMLPWIIIAIVFGLLTTICTKF